MDNKRILKNTFFLYVRMFIVMIVSLYTSRVVLNVLGVSDFGVFSVVGGFVSLFGFLNSTLSSSMSRYYNFEGGKRGEEGISEVYTTGVWIHALLSVFVLIVLETFGLWYINGVMVLPNDRIYAANVIFQFFVISMLIIIFEIPYTSAILSFEKMNLYALVSVVDALLKLSIAIALPYISKDKLIAYAALTMLITVADFIVYFVYAKKRFASIKLNKVIEKKIFKSFLSFSGWNLLGTFAFVLKGQGVNMILNVFFGTIINAARGVAFQINGAISSFSQNVYTSFRPQIVDAYSKNNFNRVLKMFYLSSKICYCLILIIIIPVICEIDYLLHIWLGNAVPEYANVFSILVLIDTLLCTLNTPVTQVTFSTGKIKGYQLCNTIVNLSLIPVCYLFLKMGLSSVSVFLITIFCSVVNQIVCLICMRKVFYYSCKNYLLYVVFPLFLVTLLLPIIPLLVKTYFEATFYRLVLISVSDVIVAALLVWHIVMDKDERQFVESILR